MRLIAIGLNHTTAPVEVRERLAFPVSSQADFLRRLLDEYDVCEAAVLATCNRSEIYAASNSPEPLDDLARYLGQAHDVDGATLESHFYRLGETEAVRHLFGVACGIDSLVIGESQILGQVRDALETAQRAGSARLLINEAFQRALRVGKRARTETDIGRGHLSVSTAAVELAGRIFDRLEGRQALLLGAGEMVELTTQYLVDGGIGQVVVANRTYERAAELARRFSGRAASLEDLGVELEEADIVISSTAAPDYIIMPDLVRRAMEGRRGRPMFLIDIAVPRDIDPQVRECDNVFLFDIDDLEEVVSANRHEREQEIRGVEHLIDEEYADFDQWLSALGTGPIIQSLLQRAEALREQELEKWTGKLAHLPEGDRKTVEAMLRGFANKLLHDPLVQIRQLAGEKDGLTRLDTIQRLFNLERTSLEEKES